MKIRVLLLLLVLVPLFFLGTAAAQAGELTWTTESVHFEGDILVIRGHFTNRSEAVVDRVQEFDVHVRLENHGVWREHAGAHFEGISIIVPPRESVLHVFRIHGVEPRRFDNADVHWTISYHWRGHRPDEFRHYRF